MSHDPSQPVRPEKEQLNTLLARAMRLLSQRDHSEAELRRKLETPPVIAPRRSAPFSRHASRRAGDAAETSPAPAPVPHQAEAIDPLLVEKVIAYCLEHHYLDDPRFTQSYINSRSRKGYGPQRIRSELMQKGVAKDLINTAFEETDVDWCRQARELAERKFGEQLPTEWKEKAKVQRFLQYRGFFQEEIQSIYRDFDE
ncbi:recombination regulator RecX [Chimaeribacter coloradensis]|uniref:Regulatory protein RecX n=1 Tax=Chimaeribacter coloradensis TaxID=2060068 RepID=A0A2N5E9L0_9GAMM|nr:recombination regulator RecX [Chimaeribacter coloradensis]PLR38586.1 recombination regulator RecX [Chimaeribacter coloradensis]